MMVDRFRFSKMVILLNSECIKEGFYLGEEYYKSDKYI